MLFSATQTLHISYMHIIYPTQHPKSTSLFPILGPLNKYFMIFCSSGTETDQAGGKKQSFQEDDYVDDQHHVVVEEEGQS